MRCIFVLSGFSTQRILTRISCILLLFLVIGQEPMAQDIQVARSDINDALKLKTSVEKDSILIHNYNHIAEAYANWGDSLARNYIDTLAELSERSDWSKARGLYHRAVGKYHDRRGDYEEALAAYSRAVEAFEQAGDSSAYLVYTVILKAFVLNNNGLYDACELELESVRDIAEELSNKNYLAWIIDAFGDHYFYSGFGKQDIPRALDYYLQVEEILPGVRNQMIIADNAHCLAGCYLRLGDEEKALAYRDKALALAEEHGLHSVIFAVYGDLADVYQEQGAYDEAIRYRQLSLDYARKTNWIEMEARAENNIAYTYKLAGDYENALIHFEHLMQIEDSLNRYDVQVRYRELEKKYEAGKKDLQIQKLEAEKLGILRNVLIALLVAVVAFGLYYVSVSRKLRKQNLELHRRNEEIKQALVKGQNIERKRMAIELHDNVNAKIAATKWMMETLQEDGGGNMENQALMSKIIQSIDDIYEDVRFISQNLVPKDIEEKSLPLLIEQLVSNLNPVQKIQFGYQIEGEPYPVAEFIKIQCYSIIMELVSNVVKHSGGRAARVILTYQPDRIVIQLIDDGKGFDPDQPSRGAGLSNVKARVQEMKGKIIYESGAGNGASILLEIPTSQSAMNA